MILIADYKEPNLHKHLCSHFAFTQSGNLRCVTDFGTFEAKGVFIDSDMNHTLHSANGPIFLFFFDKTSAVGKQIKTVYLSEIPVTAATDELISQMRTCITNTPDFTAFPKQTLETLLGKTNSGQKKEDDRVLDVLQYLKEKPSIERDIIDELAKRECLSKSRLSHLFTQETGVSLHRYLSFMKMKKAAVYISGGDSLTEGSMKAGFDSPSHFSATVQRMFGISLTEVIKSMLPDVSKF
jgi:AraC-like DNA-binding protein